jgi:hypothetical protein
MSIVNVVKGDWGRVDNSRSSCGFGADSLLLLHLLFFIRVVDDNDLAVTRRLNDVTVKVAEKFSGELRVARTTMKFSSSEDKEISIIGTFSVGPPCSDTGEQGRCDEISDGDLGGGGDLDGTIGGVLMSLGEGLPFTEGERSCLIPLLSSIGG